MKRRPASTSSSARPSRRAATPAAAASPARKGAGGVDPIEPLVRELIGQLGERPEREGLKRTPARVASALRFLTSGYKADLDRIINAAIFREERCDEMVLSRDIDLFSLCEHHLLPFYGRAHVAYIPKGRIIGLSKMPRIVDVFARRLQVQERLTVEIAETLARVLEPRGVAVVIEARHLCMMMRGVEKQNTVVTTSSMLGEFRSDPKTRAELMNLLR
jgi:GTP cyclohydrolase I